jgi:ubiquitin carboxyl-terminal hydrolase 5/13
VAGKSVFKDQCGKCFEEPKSKSGILLCLTCFNAFCPAEHLKEHVSAKPTHCLFLRIEMLEKPTPEQGIEITKVGIGIEGGAVGGPEYDTRYGLFCALCEQETADW